MNGVICSKTYFSFFEIEYSRASIVDSRMGSIFD